MPEPPKSRLDREIDEILASKANKPIDINQRRRERAEPVRPVRNVAFQKALGFVAKSPLMLAYILAVAAMIVNPVIHIVAVTLCIAAVGALWYPGIVRLIAPRSGGGPDVKYWRGQAYVSEIKSAASRSPIDSLKRYFDSRR